MKNDLPNAVLEYKLNNRNYAKLLNRTNNINVELQTRVFEEVSEPFLSLAGEYL